MVVDAAILDVILIIAFSMQELMTHSSCTRPTLSHTRRNPGPTEPTCDFTVVWGSHAGNPLQSGHLWLSCGGLCSLQGHASLISDLWSSRWRMLQANRTLLKILPLLSRVFKLLQALTLGPCITLMEAIPDGLGRNVHIIPFWTFLPFYTSFPSPGVLACLAISPPRFWLWSGRHRLSGHGAYWSNSGGTALYLSNVCTINVKLNSVDEFFPLT